MLKKIIGFIFLAQSFLLTTSYGSQDFCRCPYSYVSPLEKGHVFTEAEWLYWRVIAQIPYVGVVTIRRFEPLLNIAYPGDTKEQFNRFSLQSGYRVKLGIDLPCRRWNFYVQYQRLKNSTQDDVVIDIIRNSTTLNDTKLLYPYWVTALRATFQDKWGSVFSSQSIKYRIFDGILRKSFFVREQFVFTPSIGIRGSWIKNQLDATYVGFGAVGSDQGDIQDIVRLQNSFYGWGIRGGFQANWIIGCGLEIFGKTALSLLAGDLIFRQREDYVDIATVFGAFQGTASRETKWKKVLHNIELATGLNWGRRFCRNKLYFGLQFGYELHIWPNLIRLNRYTYSTFPNSTSEGVYTPNIFAVFQNRVTLHGITLGAKIDF